MDFSLTEEQQALAKNMEAFARNELYPNYRRWDDTGEFPEEIYRQLGDLGVPGLRVSREYGGLGLDYVSSGIVVEEVAKGDFNIGVIVLMVALAGEILENYGTEEVKNTWLVDLASGKKKIAESLTEPGSGSDAAALQTKARREGDRYILNGEKSATSVMMAADALLLFARTDPGKGARGISAFLVPTDLPGLTRQSYEDMGSKALRRGSAFLDEVAIPATYLVGNEGEGFIEVMRGFDYSRFLCALTAIGAAEVTLEETCRYVTERRAFGKPLAAFEGVSFALAEQAAKLEAVKWLCYRGLWLRDQGLPHTKEAAMCKWLGPHVAEETIHRCLLLHGHYGYTKELPLEQRLRDVIGIEIGDGTAEIQKLVIARNLLGRQFVDYRSS